MQFATDTDLAAAIAGPYLKMQPLLEFDWDKDNTWDHVYSNQSALMSSVDGDFASLHSDLPAEINSVVGSSSGVLTVRLNGFSQVSGLSATQLWSKYYTPSPLFDFTKEGTPVRYSRVVQTLAGPRTIRQFTGWVSEYLLDEATDTVTLTCSDVYDLQTTPVTLPVWAIGPDASGTNTPASSGKVSTMTPIDANWVYKEVLRQCGPGRSLWPLPRTDAVVAWACDGSMLPSVGEMGCALGDVPAPHLMTAGYMDILLMPEQLGKYGMAPVSVSGASPDDITGAFTRANKPCSVPDRGGSDPNTIYIGFAGWVYSQGSPGAFGSPTDSFFSLGTIGDEGNLRLYMYPGGSFNLSLYESNSSGSSNAGTTRTYGYVSSGNSIPLGWHYLEIHMSFTNSIIQPTARIDGNLVGPTAVPVSTAAYKYHFNYTLEEETNQTWLLVRETPVQHFQIYHGFGTPSFSAAQKDPPYVTAGKPVPARTSFGTNWLTHLPDRANKYAWDLLKEAVEGELGVLITREDGSVWMMGREDAYMYGWMPSVLPNVAGNFALVQSQAIELGLSLAWFGANPDLIPDDAQDLSRSKISGLQYNPSADTFRNAIAYHVDKTKAIQAIVWSSNDPKQFYAPSGSTNLEKYIGLPSGTLSIYNQVVDVGITPDSNKPALEQTSLSAVSASNPSFAASVGWLATAFWLTGQRQFRFAYGAGILSPDHVYVGAAQNADQANLQIGGWKYDSSDPFDEIWYRAIGPGSVADRGYFALDLGTNDWRQYPPRLRQIFDGLLRDTVNPVPVMHNLSVPTDPRRQLLDVVKLPPSKVVSGTVYAQVVGKRIRDTQDDAQDFIDVRAVYGPVEPAYWDLATWDQSAWTL